MKRGLEFTDYINASFIDVSTPSWPPVWISHRSINKAHCFLYKQCKILCLVHSQVLFTRWSALQGYRQKDYFIATQGPLSHTVEDFWRMVWEWRCHSIVMLTELKEREQVQYGALAEVQARDWSWHIFFIRLCHWFILCTVCVHV